MAINDSLRIDGNDGCAVLTGEMIEQAADLQSLQMVDMSHLYKVYSPICKFTDLQMNVQQREELGNIAKAYQRLQEKNFGLKILVTTTSPQTGINVVGALAHACNLKVKEFDYYAVSRKTENDMVVDPVSQKKIFPMDYAFADGR
jgi:hypothetical protein